ncbi:hypothetical protein JHK82_034870 [Glycine max]|nr:hypothetical protein JHK82_034870 [Glycine max]
MVIEEGEMKSQGEVESWLQQEAKKNHHSPLFSSSSYLGRQTSSIYSLTLDEFQHSLCESGKNFGSMNMDEFLSSIWNAEENSQAITNNNVPLSSTLTILRKQPSLPRQPSLSLPAPLCRKTVDEVWSQIQKEQNKNNNISNVLNDNTESAPRQPTFGEMTLEDFLVKAGVVRETTCAPPLPVSHSHQPHYANNNNNVAMAPSFVGRHVGAVSNVVAPGYQQVVGRLLVGMVRGIIMVVGIIVLEVVVVGMGWGPQWEWVGLGRKRVVDGPVEKVVERRQRRMIKNRESAARSRARKQAYTVELEAELNQLREENSQLKQALAELERGRKQQCFEEVNVSVKTKAQKAKEKLRALRRNMSCPL